MPPRTLREALREPWSAVRIFHLVEPGDWATACERGVYAPASLTTEGFIHFSFADQVTGSAGRHFGAASELLVLEVHARPDDPAVRVEDTYGTGTAFPHLYSPLAVSKVVAVHRASRLPRGEWAVSLDGGAAPASPDR